MKKTLVYFTLMLVGLTMVSGAYAAGNDEYTKLLIHSDTYDGDTSFEDSSSSGYIIYPFGNVHHSETYPRFGQTSINFDGVGDVLEVADSDDWYFGYEDFTVDFWVNFTDITGPQAFFSQRLSSNNLLFHKHDDGVLAFQNDGYTTRFLSSALSWSTNTWYHLAVVRYGDSFTIYRNGNAVATMTSTNSISNIPSVLRIGAYANSTDQNVHGYIDEFRVSKGIARWTTNFTPPNEPYSSCDSADYNNDGIVDNDDLIEKQRDVLEELQTWTECWKNQTACQ